MQREHRLRRQADFQRVRQGGRSWAHPLVVLNANPNGLDYSRVGLLASHRVGGAVKRNRARRLLREAVRRHMPEIKPGWDLVLVARPALALQKQQPVEEALLQLLRKASLLDETVKPEVADPDSASREQIAAPGHRSA